MEHDLHDAPEDDLDDAPEDDLARSFEMAAHYPLVKGFAIGRTIFGDVARDWFAGRIEDAEARSRMVATYRRLCQIWDAARSS